MGSSASDGDNRVSSGEVRRRRRMSNGSSSIGMAGRGGGGGERGCGGFFHHDVPSDSHTHVVQGLCLQQAPLAVEQEGPVLEDAVVVSEQGLLLGEGLREVEQELQLGVIDGVALLLWRGRVSVRLPAQGSGGGGVVGGPSSSGTSPRWVVHGHILWGVHSPVGRRDLHWRCRWLVLLGGGGELAETLLAVGEVDVKQFRLQDRCIQSETACQVHYTCTQLSE